MNLQIRRCVFKLSALALLAACPSWSQSIPSRDQWGERFNSAGAKLTYKEVDRTTVQDKTVMTYNLFASGLPRNQHYVLYVLRVGSDPQGVADAYLNGEGKVVNVLADPSHHVAEDPINVKLFGGKGEPFQFALLSDDGDSRAFTDIIPFPMEQTSGACQLSLVEIAPQYSGVLIRISGFHPNEELTFEQSSENEGGQSTGKADSQGWYSATIFPVVKGKRSGKARFTVTGKSCNIGIDFPWGEGSYQYQ